MVYKLLFDFGHCPTESRCNALVERLADDYDVTVTEDGLNRSINCYDASVLIDLAENPLLPEEHTVTHNYIKSGGKLVVVYIPKSPEKHQRFREMTRDNKGHSLIEDIFDRSLRYTNDQIPPEEEHWEAIHVKDGWGEKGVNLGELSVPLSTIIKEPEMTFFVLDTHYGKPIVELRKELVYAKVEHDVADSISNSGMAWFRRYSREDSQKRSVMHGERDGTGKWIGYDESRIFIGRSFLWGINFDWEKIFGIVCEKYGLRSIDSKAKQGIKERLCNILNEKNRLVGIASRSDNGRGLACGICANVFDDKYIGHEGDEDMPYWANRLFATDFFASLTKDSLMSENYAEDAREVVRTIANGSKAKPKETERFDHPFKIK
jgi:hypothetical protein